LFAIHLNAGRKGGEYAGDDDRPANFRRNGAALGLPMESVWGGLRRETCGDAVRPGHQHRTRERMEPLSGRLDDLIVYFI
jgi:hypothetical protein